MTAESEVRAVDAEVSPAELTEAVRAVRAIAALIATTMAPALEAVTMPQYRALVLLRALGPMPTTALAARLGITASTGTRLTIRLVRGGWVTRSASATDRRFITLRLTASGAALVDETRRRREVALRDVLAGLPEPDRAAALHGLSVLSDALGEPSPEDLQALGIPADEHPSPAP